MRELSLLALPEVLPDDLLHQLDVALAVADVDGLERSPGISHRYFTRTIPSIEY